jgi:spore maturation protein CgeB
MKVAFYGSSLLSSYWNGAATYYRGVLKALANLGYEITFYEPDVYDRQKHRDIDPPDWCKVVVYPGTLEALRETTARAASADVVIKASGVGFEDDALLAGAFAHARDDALTVWWDVDAPATLAELSTNDRHPLRRQLPDVDLVLTYGGGPVAVSAYRSYGAKKCVPIYNALDPETHHPVASDTAFSADLSLLANRLPDRESRVEAFFLEPAACLIGRTFLLGGSGWGDKSMPSNVRYIGHVGTASHNAFNCSPLAVLNVNRASMAETGYSPPTRIFEAAGASACLITDSWTGVECFLKPNEEILVARDGTDVADILSGLTPERAREIGNRAMTRVLKDHTYDRRAVEVDRLVRTTLALKRSGVAA